ncbi:ankyrin repeat domain-containing protein [Thermodesulfobacteriota bacterium]
MSLDQQLIHSCKFENAKASTIEYLLSEGADPNAHDEGAESGRWTALMIAARNGNTEVVRVLLDNGADVNAWDHDYSRKTPLMVAVDSGSIDTVKLFLDRGANPNAEDITKATAMSAKYASDRPEIAKLLRDRGSNISHAGGSLLAAAVRSGDIEQVRSLLEQGVDASGSGYSGNKPLMDAASNGHTHVAKTLLDRGAKVDSTNSDGETALIEAAGSGHSTTVALLLDHGADVNHRAKTGYNALWDACSSLTKPGVAIDASLIRLLLDRGAEVNIGTIHGMTSLNWAVHAGDMPAVELLLDHGADHQARDYMGDTALMKAEKEGYEEIANLLRKSREEQHWDESRSEHETKETEPITGIPEGFCVFCGAKLGFFDRLRGNRFHKRCLKE